MTRLADGRLRYGGDYNPEQWPEDVWPRDVELMREAGVTTVTVGVFSWSRIEPRPGERDLGWLDRVLDLLHDGGIEVFLATPTASPPPWLGHRHPETLPVDFDGHRLSYGSRNQFCPSSPVYREHALALVDDLAARYGDHPALALWHVGNELGQVCHCDVTAEHFRRWLRARHGSLDALNAAWHTAAWSQRYGEWDEVVPPRRAPYLINPGQRLDFARFCSDALLEHFTAERDVLRRHTPHVPVTTNFMGLDAPLDYWALAREEDVVSHDWYPDPADPTAHVVSALGFDLMRSLKDGPWLLMEQATSAVSWRRRNPPKPAGQLRAQSVQAVARGADAVCFFQWRASAGGAEKFHSAMVPHAGPDSRVFREVVALGADLEALAPVAGTDVTASVAVVLDWESWWAARLDAHPSADFDVLRRVRDFYEPLFDAGVAVDFAHPAADLTRYRLVVVPNLYLVRDPAPLVSYVEGGGTLVMGFFSGVVDEHDRVRLGGYPAPFRELLGLRVEEMAPLAPDEVVRCASASLGGFTADSWYDDLRAEGAEVVASLVDGGVPVVLRNRFGTGTAWYVGTRPSPEGTRALLDRVLAEAGVDPVLAVPRGVEAVRRGEVLFLVNHGVADVRVDVPGAHDDLLSGAAVSGSLTLGRFGVAALVQRSR
ncbi:beta-galactosidase [Saccharothrix longispora]|uniref:beta-galactosidase n=1 Tax=Saccharothrix longispora TaxID=33920 RepID=UPI0028FD9616|nr:beta-galactosidase [Saccharothrix longispora]MDU0294325.1 beta-galactosidase [Saccharothrix longispora]